MGFISSPGGNNLTLSSVDRTNAANAASGMTPDSSSVIFLGENAGNTFNGANVLGIGSYSAGGGGAGWGGEGGVTFLDSVIVGNFSGTNYENPQNRNIIILGTFTETLPFGDPLAESVDCIAIGNILDFSNVTGDGLRRSVVISSAPLFYDSPENCFNNGIIINAGRQPDPNPLLGCGGNGIHILTDLDDPDDMQQIRIIAGGSFMGFAEIGEGAVGFVAAGTDNGDTAFTLSVYGGELRWDGVAGDKLLRVEGAMHVEQNAVVTFAGSSALTMGSNATANFDADSSFRVEDTCDVVMRNFTQGAGADLAFTADVSVAAAISMAAGGTLTTDAGAALRSLIGGTLGLTRTTAAAGFTQFGFDGTSLGLGMLSGASADDAAGAEAGTIANAPSAGDPAKWLYFMDNGTRLAIPAWAVPE